MEIDRDTKALSPGSHHVDLVPETNAPFTPLEAPPTALTRGDSDLIFPLEINTLRADAVVENEYEEELRKAREAVEQLKLGADPTDG